MSSYSIIMNALYNKTPTYSCDNCRSKENCSRYVPFGILVNKYLTVVVLVDHLAYDNIKLFRIKA